MRRWKFGVAIGFNWRDLWVGVYVSKDRRVLYVCLVPCVVIAIKIRNYYERAWNVPDELRERIS